MRTRIPSLSQVEVWRKRIIINMKQLATVLSCALLCAYGIWISDKQEPRPANTISAAERPLSSVLNPIRIEVHDTVHASDTIRDTVHLVQTKIRYKVKREPCAIHREVPPVDLATRQVRKGTPVDSVKFKLMKLYIPYILPSHEPDSIPLLEVVDMPPV